MFTNNYCLGFECSRQYEYSSLKHYNNMKLNTDIIESKMCIVYAKYKSSSYPDKFLPYCLPRHAQTSNSLYATWIPDVDVNREILQKEADFCNNFAPQDEMVLQLRLGGKKVVFQTE